MNKILLLIFSSTILFSQNNVWKSSQYYIFTNNEIKIKMQTNKTEYILTDTLITTFTIKNTSSKNQLYFLNLTKKLIKHSDTGEYYKIVYDLGYDFMTLEFIGIEMKEIESGKSFQLADTIPIIKLVNDNFSEYITIYFGVGFVPDMDSVRDIAKIKKELFRKEKNGLYFIAPFPIIVFLKSIGYPSLIIHRIKEK